MLRSTTPPLPFSPCLYLSLWVWEEENHLPLLLSLAEPVSGEAPESLLSHCVRGLGSAGGSGSGGSGQALPFCPVTWMFCTSLGAWRGKEGMPKVRGNSYRIQGLKELKSPAGAPGMWSVCPGGQGGQKLAGYGHLAALVAAPTPCFSKLWNGIWFHGR